VPDVDFDAELEKLQKQNEDMKSRLEQLNENIKAAKEAMGKE
jgi:chaperonin cofactor prefoldin